MGKSHCTSSSWRLCPLHIFGSKNITQRGGWSPRLPSRSRSACIVWDRVEPGLRHFPNIQPKNKIKWEEPMLLPLARRRGLISAFCYNRHVMFVLHRVTFLTSSVADGMPFRKLNDDCCGMTQSSRPYSPCCGSIRYTACIFSIPYLEFRQGRAASDSRAAMTRTACVQHFSSWWCIFSRCSIHRTVYCILYTVLGI